MRVLIVNKFYYNRGGDCICTLSLEKMLRDAGFDVAIYSMQFSENYPTEYSQYFAPEVSFGGGVGNKIKAASRVFGGAGVKKSFASVLEQFKPDIVHFNNIHSYLSPVIVEMAKSFGAKTVWTLHDYKLVCPSYSCLADGKVCEECITGSKYGVVRRRCMKGGLVGGIIAYLEAKYWSVKRLQAATDVFIAPSKFLAGKMVEGGLDAAKLRHVCNFVNPDFISGLQVSETRKDYYVYVGRLSEEKGAETLLKAASELPYELRIAGGGPLVEELKAKYSKANIKFLGHVSPLEVKELVINAKMLVLPSECYENNPLSVIEALSLGTPVVGAKIGGIPELLKPSNGVLFRSGDVDSLEKSIRTVWNTDYNYKEISQKSIEAFSKERYLKEIMTAYGIS